MLKSKLVSSFKNIFSNPIEILSRDSYRVLHVIDGEDLEKAASLVRRGKADGFNLNFIRNMPADIDILAEAPKTKFITIHDYGCDLDYAVINKLKELQSLNIFTNDNLEIDFQKYPSLKEAAIFWRKRAESLYECHNLEKLFLGKYREQDLQRLHKLQNLRYLRINTGSVRALAGIENLASLEELWLMQVSSLKSLEGIKKLNSLKYLHIDNCKNIADISLLSDLRERIKIHLVGTTPKLDE